MYVHVWICPWLLVFTASCASVDLTQTPSAPPSSACLDGFIHYMCISPPCLLDAMNFALLASCACLSWSSPCSSTHMHTSLHTIYVHITCTGITMISPLISYDLLLVWLQIMITSMLSYLYAELRMGAKWVSDGVSRGQVSALPQTVRLRNYFIPLPKLHFQPWIMSDLWFLFISSLLGLPGPARSFTHVNMLSRKGCSAARLQQARALNQSPTACSYQFLQVPSYLCLCACVPVCRCVCSSAARGFNRCLSVCFCMHVAMCRGCPSVPRDMRALLRWLWATLARGMPSNQDMDSLLDELLKCVLVKDLSAFSSWLVFRIQRK